MARSGDWQLAPMATPLAVKPVYPLVIAPKYSLDSFGGGRPWSCKLGKKDDAGVCERWHAGVDLTGAKGGDIIVAPVEGEVIAVNSGWTDNSRAMFIRSGDIFYVLGGFNPNSHTEFGIKEGNPVKPGQKLGRVEAKYKMVHFEMYFDPGKKRTKNTKWLIENPPPDGLLNPTNVVEQMVGKPPSHITDRQKLEALKQLGWYGGSVADKWSAAATEALKAAQKAYGLDVDGLWGPMTESAIQTALKSKLPGLGQPIPQPGPGVPQPGPNTNPGPLPPLPPLPTPGGSSDSLAPIAIVGGVVLLGAGVALYKLFA